MPALSQDLAALARKERERRAKITKPAPTFTEGDSRSGVAPPATSTASPAPAEAPGAMVSPDAQRAVWKSRADAARAAVEGATQALAAAEKEIETYRSDQAPLSAKEAQDPMRLQKREAHIAELVRKRDVQKQLLANAQKSVEALEQEARRSGIPAGWLR